jgi:phenylacetate-CoA ligase
VQSNSARSSYSERCARALDHALDHVEAYRAWRALDRRDAPLDERYAGLPTLTKRLMREYPPAAFARPGLSLEQGLGRGDIELVSTSGTTEDTITNVWYQPWWDASERASWSLNAHARRVATGTHREAILSSPLNVGIPSEHELGFEARRLARFLYLNEIVDPRRWTDHHYERMLAELERYQPVVLEANPSLLSRLCRWALRRRRRPFRPQLIALTYEYPSLIHRRHIEAVFDAPIMSSYGTTEAGYVFVECEQGRLHQNTEHCRVDLLPFTHGPDAPGLGQLLVTTFDNPWRALVRFDVGDLGLRATAPCQCGRTDGLALASLEGRTVNLTTTPDGAPVTQAQVDRRLAAILEIDEYQLRQDSARAYSLHVACDRGFSATVAAQAADALRSLYGAGAEIRVAEATDLAPESSGKFRLVMARFPIDPSSFLEPARARRQWPAAERRHDR